VSASGSARPVGRWSGAGKPGRRDGGAGWPAAARGKKGRAAGQRWETAPTGGPHLSAAEREGRWEAGRVGRNGVVGRAEREKEGES
jgi:hypothetical protein